MRILILVCMSISLAACAGANPGGKDTDDLWREYCASDARQTDRQTGTTVQQWDTDATTAGHRGVSTEDKLGPNPSPPRGC